MANWHYYNKSGEKVGPISVAALKSLAQQGMITRETVIENHTGRKAVAGEVNGLTFSETVQPEPATPPIAPPSVGGDVYGLSSLQAPDNNSHPFGVSPFSPAGDSPLGNSPNPFDISTSFPMEQSPFSQSAPMAATTPRRFCSSCGSPVNPTVNFCSNCGSPTAATVSDHFAVPTQSVAQGQSSTSAQLVIDWTSTPVAKNLIFDVLINGEKMGKVVSGRRNEFSVPPGLVTLEIQMPDKRAATKPVTMDIVTRQKKKVVLNKKKNGTLKIVSLFMLSLLWGFFVSFFVLSQFGIGNEFIIFILGFVFAGGIWMRLFAPNFHQYIAKEEF